MVSKSDSKQRKKTQQPENGKRGSKIKEAKRPKVKKRNGKREN